MKRLKSESINTISFVKNLNYVLNSFDVKLEKVVGSQTLEISDLQDLNNLDSCKDFIRLNIDLLSNTVEGGEYYLTLSNGSMSVDYLCNIETYTTSQTGSGIYEDTVRFSTY
jgi:hypothetical protein|tara:strand:- start:391 stop:726 length:336 start_codon:yes stop_codon:yes gene_type:complete